MTKAGATGTHPSPTTDGKAAVKAHPVAAAADNDDLLPIGEQVFARQPFSMLLGAKLVALRKGSVEIQLPITDQLRQQNGYAHGGAISYLADNALTFAAGSAIGTNVVTLEVKLNYIRPARDGTMIARAQVISAGKRVAVAECQIFLNCEGHDTLIASALGTVITSSPAAH